MSIRKSAVLVLSLIFALVASGAAFAEGVAPTEALKAFFADRGVEAATLTATKAEAGSAQWAALFSVLRAEDDPDSESDDHDLLNSLVWAALLASNPAMDTEVTMQVGDTIWSYTPVSE